MSTQFDAEAIARATLHSPNDVGWRIAHSQTKHRLEIVSRFEVVPGSKVLEVGCGQGDFTVVLAAAVGDAGHVTAVDPASLDYGMLIHTLDCASENDLRHLRPAIHPRTSSEPHL